MPEGISFGVPVAVDDLQLREDDVRAVARDVLADKRYQILEAANAEEALRVAQEHGDLIDLVQAHHARYYCRAEPVSFPVCARPDAKDGAPA
jgi:CheY-like chemotaxis protein